MKKIFLSPIIMIIASFIFPFIYWPEMLNWPFVISRGWLPYRDFTIIHTPFLPILLSSIYQLFGFSTLTLHLFGTAILAATNLLLVIMAWKLTKSPAMALIVGLLHIFLVLTFEGNTVWFESLVALLVLGAFWLRRQHIFWSGVLFGLAVLTKQTALFLLPAFLILPQRRLFLLPVFLLGGVFILSLVSLGIWEDFVSWGIRFPLSLPSFSQSDILPDLKLPTLRQALILLLMLLIGARDFTFLPWVGLSLLFIFPRFEYFHLLVAVPFFLLSWAQWRSGRVLIIFFLIILLPVLKNTYILGNRFLTPEVYEVSAWLDESQPGKTVFSLNGPDLVYFFTSREPGVRPWVDQLPWEMAYFGGRFLEEWQKDSPQLVVFRPYLDRPVDGLGAYQPKEVVKYVEQNYKVVKIFPSGVQVLEKI